MNERPLSDALRVSAIVSDAMQIINRQIGEVVSYSVGIHRSTNERITGLEGWHQLVEARHQMIEQHLQLLGQALARIEIALGEHTAEIRTLQQLRTPGSDC